MPHGGHSRPPVDSISAATPICLLSQYQDTMMTSISSTAPRRLSSDARTCWRHYPAPSCHLISPHARRAARRQQSHQHARDVSWCHIATSSPYRHANVGIASRATSAVTYRQAPKVLMMLAAAAMLFRIIADSHRERGIGA